MDRYDAYSDRRCACWLLCALCVAAAIAGGSLLLAANEHRRAHSVAAYDRHVERWSEIARPDFARAEFSLSFNGSAPQPLVASDAPEPRGLHDHGGDVLAYAPLRYERSVPPPSAWNEASVHATLTTVGTTVVQLGAHGIPLAYRDRRRDAGGSRSCEHAGGSYEHGGLGRGECTYFYYLAELCVKVRRAPDGQWAADATGGGVGCAAGEGAAWSPARYARARGAHEPAGAAFHRRPPPRAPAPVVVRVRHVEDPLLAAANLTGGALEFPLGDAPKVAGALELLIAGTLLSVPALLFFCSQGLCGPGWPCCRCAAAEYDGRGRRARARVVGEDEFDALAPPGLQETELVSGPRSGTRA